MPNLKSAVAHRSPSMSRPEKATGGALAGAPRLNRSAMARTKARHSPQSSGRLTKRRGPGSAPASAPATAPCAMAATRRLRHDAQVAVLHLRLAGGRWLRGRRFRLADESNVALDQILNLRWAGLLRIEIGHMEPRDYLQPAGRGGDEECRRMDVDLGGLRPGA